MSLINIIRELGFDIINNDGVITADYGSYKETYGNKCFLRAVADGIMRVHPKKYEIGFLYRLLISLALFAGVGRDEMIDTTMHMDMIRQIEKRCDVQIHVRSSKGGFPAYMNSSRPVIDGRVVNVLCLTDSQGDELYGHFVCAGYHDCLGGFMT